MLTCRYRTARGVGGEFGLKQPANGRILLRADILSARPRGKRVHNSDSQTNGVQRKGVRIPNRAGVRNIDSRFKFQDFLIMQSTMECLLHIHSCSILLNKF